MLRLCETKSSTAVPFRSMWLKLGDRRLERGMFVYNLLHFFQKIRGKFLGTERLQ